MKYERLTKRDGQFVVYKQNSLVSTSRAEDDPYEGYIAVVDCDQSKHYALDKFIIRLAELEDKIENGTLIELPCKVGDTVYDLWKDSNGQYRISDKEVCAFQVFEDGGVVIDTGTCYPNYINTYLKREVAEAKLRKLKG